MARFSKLFLGALVFALLLAGFWVEVHTTRITETLGGHIGSGFLCFALLLAPLWFFGFGVADFLPPVAEVTAAPPAQRQARGRWIRTLLPALLGVPYLIFSIPRHEFQWVYFLALAFIPIISASIIEFSSLPKKLTWQDVLVLLSIAVILETRLLSGAWPYAGLGSLPKLYLADVVLYVYFVNRKLDGLGYSFIPSTSAFVIGIREWLFFAPIGIGLGLALHFIRFYLRVHGVLDMVGALLITFLLTAVPEELFFRGILQNLLEPVVGRTRALLTASVLFGLSHFHKGAMFNWRYVLLAFIAGIFYGRAWRARRQLLASSTTHTLVDVVWSLWFR
jgi:membrane protease YdiL (CAAX protease family)